MRKIDAHVLRDALRRAPYHSVFEAAPVGLFLTTSDGQIVDVNPAFLGMLGYPGRDALATANAASLCADPAVWKQWRVRLEHEPVAVFECQLKRYNGAPIWVQVRLRAVRDATGRVSHLEGALVDITEYKHAEARLGALNEIVAVAAGAVDLQTFLEALLERTLAALAADEGSVWFGQAYAGRHRSSGFQAEVAAAATAAGLQPVRAKAVEDWANVGGVPIAPLAPIMLRHGIRASLVAPLIVSGQPAGGLAIEASQPRAWSAQESAFLEAIGRQVGAVAERLRLLDEVRALAHRVEQDLAHFRMLHESGRRMAETLDLQRLADDAVRSCVETFSLRIAWIARFDDAGRPQRLACFPVNSAVPTAVAEGWTGSEISAVTRERFAQGDPVVWPDLGAAEAPVVPWMPALQAVGVRTAAVLPLVSRSGAFGALLLYADHPGFFTPDRIEFFRAYAHQLTAALENARLYDETVRRAAQLQALREIDQAIIGSLDLGLSLNIVLGKTVTLLHADAGCMLLFNPHLQALEYAAAHGFHTPVLRTIRIALGDGLAGRAGLERRRLGLNDPEAVLDTLVMMRTPAGRAEGVQATYAVPLVAKGQLLGVLQVFFRRPTAPGEDWIALLDTLAGQASIAISDIQQFQALQRANEDLVLAYDTTLAGWARALELRDRETGGHTQRVAEMAVRLAIRLRVPDTDLAHIRRGALLHDIGKMAVSDAILFKPEPLTSEERTAIELHPVHARDLLAPIQFLRSALDIPYCHHERWDGTGYPRGLKGTDIPLAARIFAVVDVWDALTSERPYRGAWSAERARTYIKEQAGIEFDPAVVAAFLQMLEED